MTEETFEKRALADDLTAYVNDKHTQEECIGFIDGYKSALTKLKNLRLGDVSKSFTATQIVELLKEEEMLDDAILFFKLQK